jgi:hypothetical protein
MHGDMTRKALAARTMLTGARSHGDRSTYPLRVGGRHDGAEHGEVLVHLPPPVALHGNVVAPLALHLLRVLHRLRAPSPPPRRRRGRLAASSRRGRHRRRRHGEVALRVPALLQGTRSDGAWAESCVPCGGRAVTERQRARGLYLQNHAALLLEIVNVEAAAQRRRVRLGRAREVLHGEHHGFERHGQAFLLPPSKTSLLPTTCHVKPSARIGLELHTR